MNATNKNALQAAVLLHEQLAGGKRQHAPIYPPEYLWNNIQQLRRQIGLAQYRGWHRAARRLTEDLADALDNCRRGLENAHRALQSRPAEPHISSAADIYRDILALDDEFEEVKIDLDEHLLSVTTDRIVLEYVDLGPYEIRLDWQRLGAAPAYRIVALDPNPAAKSDDITHPHVQDEHLCEGEGRTAIAAALAECRLHDFFVLVSQLLHTYGRGSAYVELDDWHGVPCADCGESVGEGEQYCCQRCDATLCSSCSVSCQSCGESRCSGCIGKCAACGWEYCSGCLTTCRICHQEVCDDCSEHAGLCQQCHKKQPNEEHEHDLSKDARNEPVAIPA